MRLAKLEQFIDAGKQIKNGKLFKYDDLIP